MEEDHHLCVCGHIRGQHRHLLATEIRYPCLQCTCPNSRKR